MKRTLLARSSNVATRQRVYAVADGLEVDEVDHYEIRRSRVLYDDVVLVTYHRYRGLWFFLLTGLIAGVFGWLSWLVWKEEAIVGWGTAALSVLPLLIIMAIRASFGIDEINVYGRRTRARLRFLFRKARARALLGEITEAVRNTHARRQEPVASEVVVDRASTAEVSPVPEVPPVSEDRI
jgi:hypothetical protein